MQGVMLSHENIMSATAASVLQVSNSTRQTNTRHDKPLKGHFQGQQTRGERGKKHSPRSPRVC